MKTKHGRGWAAMGVALPLICGLAGEARAQTILGANCDGDFRTSFGDNQCVGAWVDSASFGESQVCVVPRGQPAVATNDVTAGGCNTVSFGLQLIPVWLPPLKAGQYDLVVVSANGGEAREHITVFSTGGAAPKVNVAAIKAAAGAMAEPWEKVANRAAVLNDNATDFSIALALGTGDFLSAGVNLFGRLTGFAVDYNDAIIASGSKVMENLSRPLAKQYRSIEADPPDTNYTVFAAPDVSGVNLELAGVEPVIRQILLVYPFRERSERPLARAQTALANSMARELALAGALLHTLEKLQGAEAGADNAFIYLQARTLGRHAEALRAQLTMTKQYLGEYKTALGGEGLADIVYNGDELAAILNRARSQGLGEDEKHRLRAVGFSDDDLRRLREKLEGLASPPGTFSRGSLIDSTMGAIDNLAAALTATIEKTAAMLTYYQPKFTLAHPKALPGGPYTAAQGTSVRLDGSASSDPQGQALTYAWDFNLDGRFDDASGAKPDFTAAQAYEGAIGLKVTDSDGNSDMAYTSIRITPGNHPPLITSFAPAERGALARVGQTMQFRATTTDADGDPLTYEWTLDGVIVSTSPEWTHTPAANEPDHRTVVLRVRDNDPLSDDAIEVRHVALARPEIELIRPGAGPDLIWFTGLVEQSMDLQNWSLMSPQPAGAFKIRPEQRALFFRARSGE